jgi:septal ring factor EnvC (AmiA/AmiB activator)
LETVKKEAADTESKLNQLSSALAEHEETNKKLTYQLKEMQDNHEVNSDERSRLEAAQAEVSIVLGNRSSYPQNTNTSL